jgi:hypothetical protein
MVPVRDGKFSLLFGEQIPRDQYSQACSTHINVHLMGKKGYCPTRGIPTRGIPFRRQIRARPCQNSAARTSDPNPTAHPLMSASPKVGVGASPKVGVGASPKVLRALELI